MVELQSCASLVNASALRGIEQEVRGENVNVIAEISAELEKERHKNAQLMERIAFLEAQLQKTNNEPLHTDEQVSCPNPIETSIKKFKRQKTETPSNYGTTESINTTKSEKALEKHDAQCLSQKDPIFENRLVNWMSMNETQFLHLDQKPKDGDSTVDCEDSDESDEEEDDYHEEDGINNDQKYGVQVDPTLVNQETNQEQPETIPICNQAKIKAQPVGNIHLGKDTCQTGSGSLSHNKKPPKVAFCPKEVKRIIDSEALKQRNAHSHTIRKIIVFASLGTRHGCEDMYELDFNHFSILRKGEAYESATNPGEHVLYENPCVRRKVFYPNRENPTLCPVQILEEEKAMRPSDASCPSCLFLCIKYGGRTRNLPQNEYVRQRMGRNKLKSFGPLICRMAMLAHVRSGSFFFKALGITLLFMAGFPDDLVQRETKYRSLDLLQKYYRTDEEAEGEELFLLHPVTCDNARSHSSQQNTGKTCSKKSKGKKQASSINKSHNVQRSSLQQSPPLNTGPPAQFGLMGYPSVHGQSMAAFQSILSQPQAPLETPTISNSSIANSGASVSYHNQTPFHLLPPQATNAFMPMMYWPPPNTYPPGPYASTYGYRSFHPTGNYISILPQPYYNHPSLIPKMAEGAGKIEVALEEEDSTDSDSTSSSIEQKQ
ncbi:hypothetical protein UlMin_011287 [Ulmus minor]